MRKRSRKQDSRFGQISRTDEEVKGRVDTADTDKTLPDFRRQFLLFYVHRKRKPLRRITSGR